MTYVRARLSACYREDARVVLGRLEGWEVGPINNSTFTIMHNGRTVIDFTGDELVLRSDHTATDAVICKLLDEFLLKIAETRVYAADKFMSGFATILSRNSASGDGMV